MPLGPDFGDETYRLVPAGMLSNSTDRLSPVGITWYIAFLILDFESRRASGTQDCNRSIVRPVASVSRHAIRGHDGERIERR